MTPPVRRESSAPRETAPDRYAPASPRLLFRDHSLARHWMAETYGRGAGRLRRAGESLCFGTIAAGGLAALGALVAAGLDFTARWPVFERLVESVLR